jgi:hypothetical protein
MPVKLHTRAAGLGACLAMVATPQPASADRGDFILDLGTHQPGGAATLRIDVVYRHPDDPNAKPPPITGAVFRLPAGTRIETAAVPRCTATDDDLRSRGTGACPPETRVGAGTLTAITGFGPPVDPVHGDVAVFNGQDQLIEVVTAPGTDRVLGTDRLTVAGSVLTAHPPATPGGPPDGQTSVTEIHLVIDRGGYATAPPDCPANRLWSYGATFEFADHGSHAESATLPCSRAAAPLRLVARPARVQVGRRVTMRFRASSPDPACVAGAAVRFAGQRVLTDARGRATVAVTLNRPGQRRASVAKPGCLPGRTAVTARR